jgi:hypothetical protein
MYLADVDPFQNVIFALLSRRLTLKRVYDIVTTNQRIAREWLILLLFIVIGLIATYFALYFQAPVYHHPDGGELGFMKYKNPGDLSNDITSGPTILWLYILIPYFVFWFLRSIVWSVNTLRRR